MSELTQIKQWEEIPFFPNPKEEANYWANHQLDPSLLAASLSRSDGQESTSITLRIDPRMLSRLKRLAARRYLNYQSMMKQWLAERMEKENPEAEALSWSIPPPHPISKSRSYISATPAENPSAFAATN